MDNDVITLSSDEEFECPLPKRPKIIQGTCNTIEVLKKLNKLKDITASACKDVKTKITVKERNNLTIIIESDEICKISKESENDVVSLLDDCSEDVDSDIKVASSDECVLVSNEVESKKGETTSNDDCMVICAESESEDSSGLKESTQDPQQAEKDIPITIKDQNGTSNENHLKEEIEKSEPEVIVEPPASENSKTHTLLDDFLEVCEKSVKDSKYETRLFPKFDKLRENFNQSVKDKLDQDQEKSLKEHIDNAKISALEAAISFDKVYTCFSTEKLEVVVRPSTSKASEVHTYLDEFLEVCEQSLKGTQYEQRVLPKFPKLRMYFNQCEQIHSDPNLKKMFLQYTESAKISAAEAVISFQRIYSYFVNQINGDAIEVPPEKLEKVKKLERMLKKLVKVIKKLEEAEVDLNDDDSTYIMLDRYTQRLNNVYRKYCQLINRNPHSGRLSYEKIKFVHSKYNEINRALTKSCKHNKFPTYYDVEKCIRKCVKDDSLGLSENEIKEESKFCFSKMGNLLQMRRKKELYEVHCNYITLNEDPASKDKDLREKLQTSRVEGDKKLQDLVEKYVKLQDKNVDIPLSEDSDDSHYKNSDSDS